MKSNPGIIGQTIADPRNLCRKRPQRTQPKKPWRYLCFLLAIILIAGAGCFQIEDVLTVQPDGSGTVKLTVDTDLPEEMTAMTSQFGGGVAPLYPPTSEREAKYFFPAKDFTIKTEEKNGSGNKKTLIVEAAFKDVNAMLASPYARAHQLSLKTNADGTLKLQTLSGGALLAQAAQFKAEGEWATAFQMPGMEDAQKKKTEMRLQFKVNLPNPVSDANGSRQDKSVSWTIERAKCKDDGEFADKMSALFEATCSGQGLKFWPVTPARLGLVPFAQLTAGKVENGPALPDTNKIAQSAKFVPYSLQVTRSLDLSGENSYSPSQAQLTGAIVVPAELAPQRWGSPKLEEATDAKGNNLVPKENDENGVMMRSFDRSERFGASDDSPDADEDATEGDAKAKAKKPGEKPHFLSLTFKAPEWKVKKIGHIKGTIDLQYLGGSEIVKLTNAVPASLVMDMTKGRAANSFESSSERGAISDSRLNALGLSLKVDMAMTQGGMTTLSLESSGGQAALTDLQVFDADGKPWPTTLIQDSSGGDQHSCQVMVAGKPKPPFSFAVAVGGVGASVPIAILLENVPIGDK